MLMGCRHASRLCLATRTHHAALALFIVVTVTHALVPARNHRRHHTRTRAHMCSVGISVVTVAWAHAPCRNFCGHHACTRTRSRGASTARLFVTLTYSSTCHHHTANRNCLGKQHCAAITWWRRHRLRRRATAAYLCGGRRTPNSATQLRRSNARRSCRADSASRHGHCKITRGTLLFRATCCRRVRRSEPSPLSQRRDSSLRGCDTLLLCDTRTVPPLRLARCRLHTCTPCRK